MCHQPVAGKQVPSTCVQCYWQKCSCQLGPDEVSSNTNFQWLVKQNGYPPPGATGWGFSRKPHLALEYEREGKETKKRKKSATTESARKKRKNIAGGDAGPSTQTHSDKVSKISNLLIKVKLINKIKKFIHPVF